MPWRMVEPKTSWTCSRGPPRESPAKSLDAEHTRCESDNFPCPLLTSPAPHSMWVVSITSLLTHTARISEVEISLRLINCVQNLFAHGPLDSERRELKAWCTKILQSITDATYTHMHTHTYTHTHIHIHTNTSYNLAAVQHSLSFLLPLFLYVFYKHTHTHTHTHTRTHTYTHTHLMKLNTWIWKCVHIYICIGYVLSTQYMPGASWLLDDWPHCGSPDFEVHHGSHGKAQGWIVLQHMAPIWLLIVDISPTELPHYP